MSRPSWPEYWMQMAKLAATRATCDRKHVGAVIVSPAQRIVATGYNGSPAGMLHCDDVGHELKVIDGRESCIRTLHAESNALDQAGSSARGCELYTTVIPCYECAKRIINAGITRVTYDEYYQSRNTDLVESFFKTSKVRLDRWRMRTEKCGTCGDPVATHHHIVDYDIKTGTETVRRVEVPREP